MSVAPKHRADPSWVNQCNDAGTYFEPVRNRSPHTLTKEQIKQFNDRGFIDGLELYREKEARQRCREFDRLFANFYETRRDSYGINGFHAKCHQIWDIATHPRLLDHVEDLIGPNIVCWGTHYFCKLPGDSREVPFHQDATYWPFHPFKAVTAWLAIDDVTADSGPMLFQPGSHRHGKQTWRRRSENVVLDLEVVGIESDANAHPLLLNAGQFSLHTDLLVHGSFANRSSRRRCGLTIRYVPPDVWLRDESARGWVNNAIICRGSDSSERWPNNARPLDGEFFARS